MSKDRKKIRHRKTINGGQGEGEEKQEYEQIKKELLDNDSSKFDELIRTIELLYTKSGYTVLLKHIKLLHMAFVAEQQRLNKEKSDIHTSLTDIQINRIKELVSEYFKFDDEHKILKFEKECFHSNSRFKFFKDQCKQKVIERIEYFVLNIRSILGIDSIPSNFRLSSIGLNISGKSVESIINYATDNNTTGDEYLLDLISDLTTMCMSSDISPDMSPVSVTDGGRHSRYRRSPTKKYFKTRRHSSHKKKRYGKTKRHMKRHRKTKRHTMRY